MARNSTHTGAWTCCVGAALFAVPAAGSVTDFRLDLEIVATEVTSGGPTVNNSGNSLSDLPSPVLLSSGSPSRVRLEIRYRITDLDPLDTFTTRGLTIAEIDVTTNQTLSAGTLLTQFGALNWFGARLAASQLSGSPVGNAYFAFPTNTANGAVSETGLHGPFRSGGTAQPTPGGFNANGAMPGTVLGIENILPLAVAAPTGHSICGRSWGLYSFEYTPNLNFVGEVIFQLAVSGASHFVNDSATGNLPVPQPLLPGRLGSVRVIRAGSPPPDCEDPAIRAVVTGQPSTTTVALGSNASLSATVTGLPAITYVWRRDGVPISNSPRITGVFTPTLSITNVQPSDFGAYDLLATNTCGTVTSSPAALLPLCPTPNPCPADFNGINGITVQDLFDYLAAYFQGC